MFGVIDDEPFKAVGFVVAGVEGGGVLVEAVQVAYPVLYAAVPAAVAFFEQEPVEAFAVVK